MAGSSPSQMAKRIAGLESSRQKSGPSYDKDRAGRVIFFTEEVVFGRVVQEQVFAYDSSIELDSVVFDTFFPVAGLPPAEHPRPLTTQAEQVLSSAPKKPVAQEEKTARARRRFTKASQTACGPAPCSTRIFPDKNYPTKGPDSLPVQLRNAFAEEYERYVKDNQLSAKTSPEEAAYAIEQNRPAVAWMGVARQTASPASSDESAD